MAEKRILIDPDKALVSGDDLVDYVDLMNGISYQCENNMFMRGYRNEIAVNLAVGSHMLGLEPMKVLDELTGMGVIDVGNDDEDTYDRVRRVLDYDRSFNWDYMIDPDYYANRGKDVEHDDVKVFFVCPEKDGTKAE